MASIVETAQSLLTSLMPLRASPDGAGMVVMGLVAVGMVPVLVTVGRWTIRSAKRSVRWSVAEARTDAPTTSDLEGKLRAMEQRQRDLTSFFVNFPLQVERLNRAQDLKQACREVAIACEAMAGAGTILVFLLDEAQGELVLEHARSKSRGLGKLSGARVSRTLGVQRSILEQQRPVWSAGMLEVQGRHFPLELATAIRVRGDTLGMIGLGEIESARDHTERVLACLANVAAISIENAQYMERTRQLANMDRMTELYNHAYFQERLAAEFDEARTAGADLAVFLLDVDHFKAFNDREGHPAGDALLKRLARLLNSNAGFADVVARYGGEEFVVLMPGKHEHEALAVADALRELVAEQDFAGGDGQPNGRVTVSGGVATLRGGAPTAAELVKRADVALYRSKQLGRNRVLPFVEEFETERRRRDRRQATLTPASATAEAATSDPGTVLLPAPDPVEDLLTDVVRTGPGKPAADPPSRPRRPGPIVRPAGTARETVERRTLVDDEIG